MIEIFYDKSYLNIKKKKNRNLKKFKKNITLAELEDRRCKEKLLFHHLLVGFGFKKFPPRRYVSKQKIIISTIIIVDQSPDVNTATIQMFSRLSGVLSGCPPSPRAPPFHFPLFRFQWAPTWGVLSCCTWPAPEMNVSRVYTRYFSLHLTGRLLASLGGENNRRKRSNNKKRIKLAEQKPTLEIEPANYPLARSYSALAPRTSSRLLLLFLSVSLPPSRIVTESGARIFWDSKVIWLVGLTSWKPMSPTWLSWAWIFPSSAENYENSNGRKGWRFVLWKIRSRSWPCSTVKVVPFHLFCHGLTMKRGKFLRRNKLLYIFYSCPLLVQDLMMERIFARERNYVLCISVSQEYIQG